MTGRRTQRGVLTSMSVDSGTKGTLKDCKVMEANEKERTKLSVENGRPESLVVSLQLQRTKESRTID